MPQGIHDHGREAISTRVRGACDVRRPTRPGTSRTQTGHHATSPKPWTLNHIVVRVISDTQRHAGHADIVRELIDGSVGYLQGKDNLPPGDQAWWEDYRSRLERVAREVDG
ncbi:DinB family protein [Streptomyces phaeochromogenes]|nr:DinB family protein [Streptomyces umbrinus]